MNIKLTAVYDMKVKTYSPQIIPSRTIEEAIRGFKDAVASGSDSTISKYPEDYSLWLLGEFNQETGAMEPCQPIIVAQAIEFAKKLN